MDEQPFNSNTVVAHYRPDDHRLIDDCHRDRHMDGTLTSNRLGFRNCASVAAISERTTPAENSPIE